MNLFRSAAFATVFIMIGQATSAQTIQKTDFSGIKIERKLPKAVSAKTQTSHNSDVITNPSGTAVTYSRSSYAIAPLGDQPMETEDYGFAGVIVTGSALANATVPGLPTVIKESQQDILNLQTEPLKLQSVMNATPAKELAVDPIITEAPAGTAVNYSRNAIGYTLVYGMYLMFTEQLDQAGQIIDGDDGFVYIKNPISALTYNAYFKGTREGDRIRVDLPQIIYEEPSTKEEGKMVSFYDRILDAQFDDEGNRYFVPAEQQTLYYNVSGNEISLDLGYTAEKGEDGTYPYPDKVVGITTEDGTWAYYSDCWQEWTKLDQDMQKMPEGLTTEKWGFFHNGIAEYVDLAIDGDYVYVTNMYSELPNAVIKGRIEGDKVIFESGAYIGDYVSYYIYQMMCYMNEGNPELRESLTMDFDRENNVIAATDPNDIILFNTSLNRVYALTNFQNPRFVLPGEITDPTPMTPKFNEFMDFYDTYGYAYLVFDIFSYNDKYEIFNPDDMWYHLILDGIVETIVPEDYIMLPEEMTNIPFNFKDSYDIHIEGSKRTFCIYAQGIGTAGIQLFHEYGGKVYASEIMTYDVDNGEVSTGVSAPESIREVVSTEWYNLQGQRVMNPGQGIYICKTNFADGTSNTMKFVRR